MTPQVQIEETVGTPPGWLMLGEPTIIDGVKVREVLGDWSDRAACDQPPKYVADTTGLISARAGFDTSESREPVRQAWPGRPIADLHGIHSGKCAILFNGPSLKQHDLWQIRCPIIGMNRTHQGFKDYQGPQPNYLCIVDWVWLDRPDWSQSVKTHPCIINGSSHQRDIGYRVVRHPRMSPFSFDLARDGYVGPVPCTTGYLALQFAVYLGFTDIYCLGLDMGGGHFDGTKGSLYYTSARAHLRRIAKVLEERSGVKVWVCGSPQSACDAFPQASFEDLLA